jgi:hypothetical protein
VSNCPLVVSLLSTLMNDSVHVLFLKKTQGFSHFSLFDSCSSQFSSCCQNENMPCLVRLLLISANKPLINGNKRDCLVRLLLISATKPLINRKNGTIVSGSSDKIWVATTYATLIGHRSLLQDQSPAPTAFSMFHRFVLHLQYSW